MIPWYSGNAPKSRIDEGERARCGDTPGPAKCLFRPLSTRLDSLAAFPHCPYLLRALFGLEEVLQARVAADLQAGPIQGHLQLAPRLAVDGRMRGESWAGVSFLCASSHTDRCGTRPIKEDCGNCRKTETREVNVVRECGTTHANRVRWEHRVHVRTLDTREW